MSSKEFFDIIIKVLFSPQVFSTALVIIFFIILVNYVARARRRPRRASSLKYKKKKAISNAKKLPSNEVPEGQNTNDSLGLEERY
ncbi:MAG: hypothetical protein FWH41_04430 [Treponema sp.]|nr:hypothetical protein [Treponema sp.]